VAKEYVLLVAEGCKGCEEAKLVVKEYPDVKVIDVTKSLYGADIIRQTGIYQVPLLVEIDKANDEVCILKAQERVACVKESILTRDDDG
jgi:hypothetical protein